jgi:hypothetical protein
VLELLFVAQVGNTPGQEQSLPAFVRTLPNLFRAPGRGRSGPRGRFPLEHGAEPSQCAVQPDLDRVRALDEELGDLPRVEVGTVLEHEQLSVALVETRDRRVEVDASGDVLLRSWRLRTSSRWASSGRRAASASSAQRRAIPSSQAIAGPSSRRSSSGSATPVRTSRWSRPPRPGRRRSDRRRRRRPAGSAAPDSKKGSLPTEHHPTVPTGFSSRARRSAVCLSRPVVASASCDHSSQLCGSRSFAFRSAALRRPGGPVRARPARARTTPAPTRVSRRWPAVPYVPSFAQCCPGMALPLDAIAMFPTRATNENAPIATAAAGAAARPPVATVTSRSELRRSHERRQAAAAAAVPQPPQRLPRRAGRRPRRLDR